VDGGLISRRHTPEATLIELTTRGETLLAAHRATSRR